ncbi:MAG: zinc-ribbon domain-containing protein [Candidatus Bathyarchaeia archaeon]
MTEPQTTSTVTSSSAGTTYSAPETQQTKYCSYCGAENSSDALYCVRCGKKQ